MAGLVRLSVRNIFESGEALLVTAVQQLSEAKNTPGTFSSPLTPGASPGALQI